MRKTGIGSRRLAALAALALAALTALTATHVRAAPARLPGEQADSRSTLALLPAARERAARRPDDVEAQWSYAVKLAIAAPVMDDPVAAYRQSIGIVAALAGAHKLVEKRLPLLPVLRAKLAAALAARGTAYAKAHDDDRAIAAFRESAAVDRERDDSQARYDLGTANVEIAYIELRRDNRAAALVSFREAMALMRAAVRDEGTPKARGAYAKTLGLTCYADLMERRYDIALPLCDEAIALAPTQLWLRTNQAHLLMMLGRTDEARAIYLAHRGQIASEDTKWDDAVRDDFATMRKIGITAPLMAEIEAELAKPAADAGKPKP